ncbi:MAG: nickel pincer cofactor biosynthesis protein LarC [Terriglobia bacterium]
MKLAYLDCFSGISGDMLLGALVDAGLPVATLEAELRKLDLKGWKLAVEHVRRGELAATKLTFEIPEEHTHRTGAAICKLIRSTSLTPACKTRAEAIFDRLATVEAAIHQQPKESVHLHELGAADTILDIVGACVGLEVLGIEKIVCSPLNLGGGMVKTAHGVLPVPAPATAQLLQGAPVYSTGVKAELVTPTGAAIVSTLAAGFGALPPMKVSALGYGAGSRSLAEHPNVLRIFIGESAERGKAADTDSVAVLEANLDDMSPLVGGYFVEQALAAGALDVYFTPVHMKKNRPGVLLTVLCPPERIDALSELVFQQTTTIGLRIYEARRRTLERETLTLETPLGPVRMKLARLNGHVLNAAPEYEDCQRIAKEHNLPLKQVLADAHYYFRKQQGERD